MLYRLFREKLTDPSLGSYWTYGIQGGGVVVHDVGTDESFVQTVVSALNAYDVEPCHVWDIVEDFLAGEPLPYQLGQTCQESGAGVR
ncbi:hypothetical protein [uncultured Ruthenibacterium sp.]|uniref:DUF6514 family protein n=1 Tax=uncultured Ruthenibacterium sp. TaxID=1905347 RepID=UPI00349F0468